MGTSPAGLDTFRSRGLYNALGSLMGVIYKELGSGVRGREFVSCDMLAYVKSRREIRSRLALRVASLV